MVKLNFRLLEANVNYDSITTPFLITELISNQSKDNALSDEDFLDCVSSSCVDAKPIDCKTLVSFISRFRLMKRIRCVVKSIKQDIMLQRMPRRKFHVK